MTSLWVTLFVTFLGIAYLNVVDASDGITRVEMIVMLILIDKLNYLLVDMNRSRDVLKIEISLTINIKKKHYNSYKSSYLKFPNKWFGLFV